MAAGKGPVLRMLLLILVCITAVLTFGSFFTAWYTLNGEKDQNSGFTIQMGEIDYLTYIFFTMATTQDLSVDGKKETHEATLSLKFKYSEARLPALGVLYGEVTALLALGMVLIAAEVVFNTFSIAKHRTSGKFGDFCRGRVLSILICIAAGLALITVGGACFLATSAAEKRAVDGGLAFPKFQSGCGGNSPPAWCSSYTGTDHGPTVGWIMALFSFLIHLPIVGLSIYSAIHLRLTQQNPINFEQFGSQQKTGSFNNNTGDTAIQMDMPMVQVSSPAPAPVGPVVL
eukprot:TRINITY_DN27104_c0_g1_i1.p1 TRINITY_DN27104_c0_g1~~TRINITY_DN27104_c0_g1_i1.p1  ORF type:complete len:287 (-),score=26.39 TRINITY_DN27104_c0_g1_i1:341-1201(-)